MKKLLMVIGLGSVLATSAFALTYNQVIVAIFGSGNPDTGWTVGTGGVATLALRAKNREDASTFNVNGVYAEPVGLQAPANNRARWNWEWSINSGSSPLGTYYDYYVGVDTDPSQCTSYVFVNALTFWNDNSYGDSTTLNGQGSEGLASAFPTATIAQQSQNLVFAGGNPNIDATWSYTLFAVAKGAGVNGTKVASTSITVVVGTGGAVCDSDGDGIPDDVDACPDSDLGQYVEVGNVGDLTATVIIIGGGTTTIINTVDPKGCSIQDKVNNCALGVTNHGQYVSCVVHLADSLYASGLITLNQRQQMVTGAAKSDVGK